MRNIVIFYNNKGIDMSKLVCVFQLSPNCRKLHISILLKDGNKTFSERSCKVLVGGSSIVHNRQAVIDETVNLFQKPLWLLMLVSFILILCVKRNLWACTRDGSQILNLASLKGIKTKRRFLKTYSNFTFRN